MINQHKPNSKCLHGDTKEWPRHSFSHSKLCYSQGAYVFHCPIQTSLCPTENFPTRNHGDYKEHTQRFFIGPNLHGTMSGLMPCTFLLPEQSPFFYLLFDVLFDCCVFSTPSLLSGSHLCNLKAPLHGKTIPTIEYFNRHHLIAPHCLIPPLIVLFTARSPCVTSSAPFLLFFAAQLPCIVFISLASLASSISPAGV
jgi:hypothetical protein